MNSSELRESFLKFFEKKGHTRVASSPLIPVGEPTLFFVNAGMVQFKNLFTGQEKRPYPRATTSQKCLRVSGKHNDLEQVGYTPRHHTFFEMLGNFSFGDYFKEDAIKFAWEYLTEELKLSKDKMVVTVYKDDEEALELWTKFVPKERIFKLGEKDNFWSMGDAGPCGPCSEIHWDFGKGEIKPSDFETDRFMEIWNLVFMQFDRDAKGKMTPLASPSIDTGMGLERLACVVEGKRENWETDVFVPIIKAISKSLGHKQGESKEVDVALKVIADHLRAMVFMIESGVIPSNEGRGYILRRIIRRAVRYGRMLGMDDPFLSKLAHVVIDQMGEAYPELVSHFSTIEKVIAAEEERFFRTLDKGLDLLDEEFKKLKKDKKKTLSGEVVFRLYDTFGFPKDLTELIARESGIELDDDGFDAALEKQRAQSRESWKGSGEEGVAKIYQELAKKDAASEFVGYDEESVEAKLTHIIDGGELVKEAKAGAELELIFDRTPFYGESGGQVGDMGVALSKSVEIEIKDAKRPVPELIIHKAKIKSGKIKVGDKLTLAIDSERRQRIRCNHTATHLLHKALREVLGEHVRQSGSLVEPDRLRFDFSHFHALTNEEVESVEALANQAVRANHSVETDVLPYKQALTKGALAFFGEKYSDHVRMVQSGDFSCELCGGTHVKRTGEIGLIKITSESSVAAGIRRLEAVTAGDALNYVNGIQRESLKLAQLFKVHPNEIFPRVEKLLSNVKDMEKKICEQKQLAQGSADDLLCKKREVSGVAVLTLEFDGLEAQALRRLSDDLMSKIGSGIVLLASKFEDKVSIIISVSKDLQGRFQAGKLVKELTPIIGGKGGGRPDMAQGGG
ncbi:MAG: alanine--tRNA ligase, partial [Pseudomonadota bacterium]